MDIAIYRTVGGYRDVIKDKFIRISDNYYHAQILRLLSALRPIGKDAEESRDEAEA